MLGMILKTSRRRFPLAALSAILIAIALVGLTACSSGSSADNQSPTTPTTPKIKVVATTAILGDLVQKIGGDQVDVSVLIPAGADPHEFEASASQVAKLRDAQLVVANGLDLEERLTSVLDQAANSGVKVFSVAPLVDPIVITNQDESDHGHDHGSENDKGETLDPHFWLDPTRMAQAASLVADQLIAAGVPATVAEANAAAYANEAKAAEAQANAILQSIPSSTRKLITNHDALGYFAQRFGFTVIGTVIPGGSTLAEPSAADVRQLAQLIRTNNLPAIFSESTTSPQFVETIAREAGRSVKVVTLPIESFGSDGITTYSDLIIAIANGIANGLGSRPS